MNLQQKVTELENRVEKLEKAAAATATIPQKIQLNFNSERWVHSIRKKA
jgi:uncharacterized protein YlxW (UPF0749 family)